MKNFGPHFFLTANTVHISQDCKERLYVDLAFWLACFSKQPGKSDAFVGKNK